MLSADALLDPIALLKQQVKDKTLKKIAIEEISTIALALGQTRTQKQLLPYLAQLFIQQHTDMRIVILKSLNSILSIYHGSNEVSLVLEILLDTLCVFTERELRKEGFCLLKQILRQTQKLHKTLMSALKQIEPIDRSTKEVIVWIIGQLLPKATEDELDKLQELLEKMIADEEGREYVAQELPQMIEAMPQVTEESIMKMFRSLMATGNTQTKINLIDVVIKLAVKLGPTVVLSELDQLSSEEAKVFSALILKIKELTEVFSPEQLKGLLSRVDGNYVNEDSLVKSAIIQVLEFIPYSPERRAELVNTPQKSLNLSKVLGATLCRIGDVEALTTLIRGSDNDFKLKVFPKLPEICELHVEVLEAIFSQKNWRSKLVLLTGIEKKVKQNENGELLLAKLFEQLGDKIAVVRVSVVKTIFCIVQAQKIKFSTLQRLLTLGANSQNWFQRQSIFLLIQMVFSSRKEVNLSEIAVIRKLACLGQKESVKNILKIVQQIYNQLEIKHFHIV